MVETQAPVTIFPSAAIQRPSGLVAHGIADWLCGCRDYSYLAAGGWSARPGNRQAAGHRLGAGVAAGRKDRVVPDPGGFQVRLPRRPRPGLPPTAVLAPDRL